MCEADLSSADQVVIFKGDFACLQAINLTNSTTGGLVFIGGTKFLPVGVSSEQNVVRWNSLLIIGIFLFYETTINAKTLNKVINEVAAEEDVHDVKTQKPVSLTDNKCHQECVENLENPKPQVTDNCFFTA